MSERRQVFELVAIFTCYFVFCSVFVTSQQQYTSPTGVGIYETRRHPFTVTWNVQSHRCIQFGIDFNLSSYNIISNKEEEFRGDHVALFYTSDLGLYPHYLANGTAINGGLPQHVNLSVHFLKLSKDMNALLPDPKFDGLAIVDWESWRPIFRNNRFSISQRIYITKSEELVREQHPQWEASRIKQEARIEFEMAARLLMAGTLTKLYELRPFAKWGYYGFPQCLNYQPGERDCNENVKKANDEKHWLFSVSNVLYPSIYLTEKLKTQEDRYDRVDGILSETMRVHGRFSSDNQSTIAFTRFSYSDTEQFYSKADLDNTIGQSFDAGVQGVTLWGAYKNFITREKCQAAKQYIDNLFGPYVKNKTAFALNCSKSLCSGHGFCVSRTWQLDTTQPTRYGRTWSHFWRALMDMMRHVASYSLSNNVDTKKNGSVYEGYQCKCNRKWKGQHCDTPVMGGQLSFKSSKSVENSKIHYLNQWIDGFFLL